MLKQLWMDEAGFCYSVEVIILCTLAICGIIVGGNALRDGIVGELSDLGHAIGSLNQSYSYHGLSGHCSLCAGSQYADNTDYCENGADPVGDFNCCIGVVQATPEGNGQ